MSKQRTNPRRGSISGTKRTADRRVDLERLVVDTYRQTQVNAYTPYLLEEKEPEKAIDRFFRNLEKMARECNMTEEQIVERIQIFKSALEQHMEKTKLLEKDKWEKALDYLKSGVKKVLGTIIGTLTEKGIDELVSLIKAHLSE